MKWLVRLKGERFDLKELPNLLNAHDLKVIEREGMFYMQSTDFGALTDAEEVRERARALIKIVNAAARFHLDDFHDVAEDGVTRIDDDGRRHHVVFGEASGAFRSRLRVKGTVIGSGGQQAPAGQPSTLVSLIDSARRDRVVADALHFYADDTWFSLYKAYELIRDDAGGEGRLIGNSWVAKRELSRFSQTAQSRAVLGDSARHASDKYKPPSKPMSLSEAKMLIKSILLQWLNTK